MYTDLADAVEDLEEQGVHNLSEQGRLVKKPERIRGMNIVATYCFDSGTDPGDESTLYLLELPDKSRGYLILSYGMYTDPDKSDLIDELEKLERKGTK